MSLELFLEWAQIHLCMKTRHDQSPDISEDDYNKFSDPEKKSQKFMKKTKFKKVLLNSNISPKKSHLWYDQTSFVKSL